MSEDGYYETLARLRRKYGERSKFAAEPSEREHKEDE